MNRPTQGPGRTGEKVFLLVTTFVVLILIVLTAEGVVSARQLRTFYQQSPIPTATFTPTATSSAPTPTDTPVPPTPTDTPVPPTPTDTPVPPTPTDTPVPLAHITGGGWFDSPSGAYTSDADLAGRAHFGFVAKQSVGAGAPTGNTQFQFHAGELNFQSNSYQWLVINADGGNAQFKGEGTVSGDEHLYNFMIWASDGNPDTYRIKIWRETPAGELRLYDNGSREPIAEGSIVIHNGQ